MGCANIAAQIHANMCNDDRFGYSQYERYGSSETVTWNIEGRDYTINVGDFDCSSSDIKAWQLALKYTDYEGALDGATYTGNIRSVFENSGLFYSSYDDAKRGDVYLNDECHTAMCQDGGSDGVFGYDCLSEFCISELGTIYGERGDQTGYEAYIHGYYDYPWNATLHYNGNADASRKAVEKVAKQEPGAAVNNAGLYYRAHVQNLGWCDAVHDGQTAGTVGCSHRMEAIKIRPPKSNNGRWLLEICAHIQNEGWKRYIVDGNVEGSGEGSSEGDPIIGTVGKSLRLEALIIRVLERPANDNRKLYFRVHQQNVGWKGWTEEGYCSGSDAEAMRLEAIQMKIQ